MPRMCVFEEVRKILEKSAQKMIENANSAENGQSIAQEEEAIE